MTKRVDSYDLTMSPMETQHLPRLAELSVTVRWPQRLNDWEMVQQVGEGLVALDPIGRLAGTAMMFRMGETLAHIGMVITAPRLQARGTGRWLMDEVMQRSEGMTRLLNATRESYRLYLSLDFQPVGRAWQQQGTARAVAGHDPRVRPGVVSDHGAVHALDLRAFGVPRQAVLEYALRHSDLIVLEDRGVVQGFAMCRSSGRGHVIGPVIARSEEDAIALIRPLVAARPGQFLRMDTRHAAGPLKSWLEAAGLMDYDSAMTMSLGPPPDKDPEFHTFGLVSQAVS